MKGLAIALLATVVLGGCVSPKLTRHYDSMDETTISDDQLTLSTFLANPKADEEAPFITKLSERGQAELIKSVTAKLPLESDANALLIALGKASTSPPDPCAWSRTTSIKKRMTITVMGNLRRPADRVDRLQFDFELDATTSKRAAFASWDKFDSVYGSYDLGTAKYTQSRKLTLGGSDTDTEKLPSDAGSVVKLLNAGYEASNSLEENMKYSIRRLSVGGALTPAKATLVQEGGPYINLLGSSSAVITLKLETIDDPHPVHVLDFKKGRNTLPEDVGVTRCNASYPKSAEELKLRVGGSALKRTVYEHHDTISEGDDMVKFTTKDFASSNLTFATASELKVNFFGLAFCTPKAAENECLLLAMENPEAGKVTDAIMLRTSDDAAKLRDWLVANVKADKVPETIGHRRIGLVASRLSGGGASQQQLTSAIVRSFRVMRLGGN